MSGLWNLLAMRFDASPHPERGVCHLQILARTSVTVDALPFGQIWFRFGLSYEFEGQAYSRTGLRESICHSVQIQNKVRGAKVCLLFLLVRLILWAKHTGLFVASFC